MIWGTKFFCAVVLIIGLLIPSKVFAVEYGNKAYITYKGKSGYFFDEETGDRILKDLMEYRKLKYELVPNLKLKINLLEFDLVLYKKNLEYTESILQKTEESKEEMVDLHLEETTSLKHELAKKKVWYKTPAPAFIAGVFVGALTAVGIAFGLQNSEVKR